MNIFPESHQTLLKVFLQHKVKFMLVGGYAVVYYGYKRTTGDMDLWLEPSNENKLRLLKAFTGFEFNAEDLKHISSLDFTQHIAFHFWEEPERVDCMTYISNVSFEEADKLKTVALFDEIEIPVIHYNHLIVSKISSERLKELEDAEELQKINHVPEGKLFHH